MYSLGFLGAGWMGSAIIGGIKEHSEDTECLFFDPSAERCEALLKQYGLRCEKSSSDLYRASDGLVIAVKPQVYPNVADEIAAGFKEGQLLISIMAGVSLTQLAEKLPKNAKVVRLMPNLAMTVGAGTTLMSCNDNVTEAEKQQVINWLKPVSAVKEIPEHLMDAGTSLSGSTPALFYTMIDAMMLAGVKIGFTKADAEELAVRSLYGAAMLLNEPGNHATELRNQMMSAGGTTVAGVCALQEGNFCGDVIRAVTASYERSKELNKGDKHQ